MDYRKLRSFLALAQSLHFARAAAAVNLTQPALTQHIQALEQQWGVKLFDRDKRKVSLTREGALLLGDVRQTVQRLEQLQNMIKQVAAGRRGMLRIGYVGTSMLEPALVRIIRAFRRNHPQVALELLEYSVNEQLSLLESGDLDIGILRGPLPERRQISRQILHQTSLCAVLADDHPLAQQARVMLADLLAEPLILQEDPEGIGLGGAVLNLYAAARQVPDSVLRARDVATAIDLAALGLGVTFIPYSPEKCLRQDVALLPLAQQDVTTELYLCWKTGADNPDIRRFAEYAQSHFADNAGVVSR
ncbi:LysR family transcriptional regulator [Pantoea dispersa]|uniref:LysR family transcriptional regulator n=1 Tax=Pantoea dispersa TaxID=59814 RepID=UPI002DBD5662|nr:LysR family transcriptional regulator [Pantoea dispersa]MEB5971438.1 LysR family transcriptional regulator [Pantoea dispersa]